MTTTTASPTEQLLGLSTFLTPTELDWQQRAREFAATRIAPTIDDDYEREVFRRELVPELGALGVLGMHLTGYGCAGAGAVSYGLVCHELEAADSAWRTLVSVQGSLAMTAISTYGSDEQKSRWLARMAAGEAIGCFALTEPDGGSDPAAMTTRAVLADGEWLLTGRKRWIGLASVADVAVVWASTAEGIRGFVVPADSPGFDATNIAGKLSMRASIQCDVELRDVRLPESAMLPGAEGLAAPFSCLGEARYGIVWGAMGAARACLDAAVGFSQTRMVFGAPIGAKQLIQQKLADAFVEYEKGMLLALHLGRLADAGTLTPQQVSVGKLNNVREAIAIVSSMRSVLGGDGITSAYPVMRHAANLEAVRTYEGTDEVHTLVIGRALTGLAAFR